MGDNVLEPISSRSAMADAQADIAARKALASARFRRAKKKATTLAAIQSVSWFLWVLLMAAVWFKLWPSQFGNVPAFAIGLAAGAPIPLIWKRAHRTISIERKRSEALAADVRDAVDPIAANAGEEVFRRLTASEPEAMNVEQIEHSEQTSRQQASGHRMRTSLMTLDEYQERAFTTAVHDESKADPIIYLSGKLACEAGEAHQVVLKKAFHNSPADDAEANRKLKKELGDALWYLSGAARQKGWALSEIAFENLVKIEARKLKGTLAGSGDDR